jgi:bifunctional UDP-N-acetylglucosamine pyrophosphorylase/glucosamine-1-phosphate N-acetyltransferase
LEKTSLASIGALIAAAGRGTRAGLPYPKTLYPVQGRAILLRIFEMLRPYDATPTVIVSPCGAEPIGKALVKEQFPAHFVIQPEPKGMGDAVLRYAQSPAYESAEHVVLIWGDVPFVQPETVSQMIATHLREDNDFTFVTRRVARPYTVVSRDGEGRVDGVIETREAGGDPPAEGERDIGLFVFRKQPVFEMLRADLPGRLGHSTGEHGFLYVIEHLSRSRRKIAALPIAKEIELVSLNSLKDVSEFD